MNKVIPGSLYNPITNEGVMSRLPKSTGEEDRQSVENIRREISLINQRKYSATFRNKNKSKSRNE